MPTTPVFAFRYPAPTDPADVPTDIGNLATDVENTVKATPGYGTTLPATPRDGQEYVLVDSVTNPSYQWRFRYNAGSTSAYKWEFVGGSEPQVYPGNINASVSSSSYAALTGGPTFALPRTGDYRIRIGGYVYATDTATLRNFYLTPVATGLAAQDSLALQVYTGSGAVQFATSWTVTAAGISGTLSLQARSGSGTTVVTYPVLGVQPVRVS
jgi:hypothetical protein